MKFSYQCGQNFNKNLGELDAMGEALQVAIASFSKNARESGLLFDDYLLSEAEKTSIRVNTVDWTELPRHLARLNIVTVDQCFDGFLTELKSEFPASTPWTKKDGENAFNYTVRIWRFQRVLWVT